MWLMPGACQYSGRRVHKGWAFELGFDGCVGVHHLVRVQVRSTLSSEAEVWNVGGGERDRQDSHGESGMGRLKVSGSPWALGTRLWTLPSRSARGGLRGYRGLGGAASPGCSCEIQLAPGPVGRGQVWAHRG